jgi:hypothetical protein
MPILVAMDAKKKTLSRKQVAYSIEILDDTPRVAARML